MMPNLLEHLIIAIFMVLSMKRKIARIGPVLSGGNLLKTTKVRDQNEKAKRAFND